MKAKRFLCVLLIFCILAPMLPSLPARAEAPKWNYGLWVWVPDVHEAQSKKNAITATFYFSDGTSVQHTLSGTNKKKAYSTVGWFENSHAPWTLEKVVLKNNTTNGFYMNNIEVRCIAGYSKQLAKVYPGGTSASDGVWIDKNDGHPQTYTVEVNGARNISKADGFSDLAVTEHFTLEKTYPKGYIEKSWNGTLSDQYSKYKYNAWECSGTPTITAKISGYDGNGSSVTKENLAKNGLIITEKGYKYNRYVLSEYMRAQNINNIELTLTLSVPKRLSSNSVYTQTVTAVFTQDLFAFKNVSFKNYSFKAGTDNYYYNASGSIVKTEAVIDTDTKNFSHFKGGKLNGKTLVFDNAYLLTSDGTKIPLKNQNTKSAKITNGKVSFEFQYGKNTVSGGNGLNLVIENGKINADGANYELWDKSKSSSVKGVKTYKYYASSYKLDSESPSISVNATDGTDLSKWNKTVSVSYKPNEEIYLSGSRTQGKVKMSLVPKDTNTTQNFLYGFENSSPSKKSSGGRAEIPISESGTKINIALDGTAEGEYQLVFEGEDIAGNKIKTTASETLKLDNKAPSVTLRENQHPKASDGTKSSTFDITFTDASDTGRLYYKFTQKSLAEIKKEIAAGTPSGSAESGAIESVIDKWAFVDKTDIDSGKIDSVLLKMEKGESFEGRIVYYAVDAAGNTSECSELPVAIHNDDTTYSITPSNLSAAYQSYSITIDTAEENTVLYRWYGNETDDSGKQKTVYLFGTDEFKTYNGTFSTAQDKATAKLNGTYYLEVKITGKYGSTVTFAEKYVFDNEGPVIGISISSESKYIGSESVAVTASDTSGISEAEEYRAFAEIIYADGSRIDDGTKIPLKVTDGFLKDSIYTDSLESGAYALYVCAFDTNGNKNELVSEPFFVRNGAPDGTVKAVSDKSYEGNALVGKDRNISIEFDISEEFAHSDEAGAQLLYYRTGTSYGNFGEWICAGKAETSDSGFAVETSRTISEYDFSEGLNVLFVQTALCPDGILPETGISSSNIKDDEIEFYFDETAPNAVLAIDDVHTAESITGTLFAEDNLDSELCAVCRDENVKIGKFENGAFSVTVSKNTDTEIEVTDDAGNTKVIELLITGIDTEPPTAELSVSENKTGGRRDAEATLRVYGMVQPFTLAENIGGTDEDSDDEYETEVSDTVSVGQQMFALIPADKYSGGKIDDKYFKENLSDDIFFEVREIRSDRAVYEGESNNTYSVKVAGADGEWYFGVRAMDSLGNTADIVFDDLPLVTEYPELTAKASANPMRAENMSIVTVEFSRPVYTLAQDKILSDAGDEENLNLAEEYAMSYSLSTSFKITDNGEYTLYTVDDIGNAEKITVEIDGVEFGASGDVEYKLYSGNDFAYDVFEEIDKDDDGEYKMICPSASYGNDGYFIEITPKSDSVLLLPEANAAGWEAGEKYGFQFSNPLSSQFAVDKDGNPIEDAYFEVTEEIFGYTKLIYRLVQMYNDDGTYSNSTERTLFVRAFDESNYAGDTSEKIIVVPNVDNTLPNVEWTVSPQVLEKSFNDDGMPVYKGNPTPGSVTFTFTAQDAESGIAKTIVLAYNEETANGDVWRTIEAEPDEDGYWCWDGADYEMFLGYEENPDTGDWEAVYGNLPVKIEFYGEKDDIYGIKTLKYTYTDEYDLSNFYKTAYFVTGLGIEADMAQYDGFSPFSSEGLIYRMPIEENVDYVLKYFDENGKEIPSDEVNSDYRKEVTAVVEIPEDSRGEERGLYAANNSGSLTAKLNEYRNSFTFRLADKYGYEAEAKTVSVTKFDTVCGTLSYSLETEAKTNKSFDVTIIAQDAQSGVGTVLLKLGSENIELEKQSASNDYRAVYKGTISKNGTYSITMYDKSGNKTAENFSVKNISTVVPTASVTYSSGEKTWSTQEPNGFYTSRPVTASLEFSKPNVRIINAEPVGGGTFGADDYHVNYGTASVTFLKSGSIGIEFEDDYGNAGSTVLNVGVIDNTPPKVTAVVQNGKDLSSAYVTFEKITDLASEMDINRKETDIIVSYGGIAQTVANSDGSKNGFAFRSNGSYTFKVYDAEGLASVVEVTIDGIDKYAPKITKVSWSYDYDEYDAESGTWITKTAGSSIVPADGTVGYRVASDENAVTNYDVTVSVETDSDTRFVGGSGEYGTVKEKQYDENGFFIFNTEKKNGLSASYGVDIRIIDKTPPTINLFGASEAVFYENPNMNETQYSKDLFGYEAYDEFGGVKTSLTDSVEVDWGGFDPDNLYANTFDSSKPYTITYTVTDKANNTSTAKRTIRLVGMYDTIAAVNGKLPDYSGKTIVSGNEITLSLKNFSGTAYVKYSNGIKTMGEMKKTGTVLPAGSGGEWKLTGLEEGWYTLYVQTDKRDYFTICVYAGN